MSRLRHVERALEEGEWLCAGRFTAADISVGYALLLASHLELLAGVAPTVLAYWQRLQGRAEFQAAKRAQGADLSESLSETIPAPPG